MELKLSIIVPVYNVAAYLPKCIDSLLAQDLPSEEYEIILVDDGSPDGCSAMCDEYAIQHKNISVIHRPNGGLSAARNSGIAAARGEYVQFVDSDDYLEHNVLRALVNKMDNEKLDVLRFNYQNVNERYEVFEPNKVRKPFIDFREDICDGLTFLAERLGTACYACQFMMKRSLLENCLFKEGIYFEDVEWTPRILLKAERVSSVNTIVYNYLYRVGSITRGADEEKMKKRLEDRFSLIDSLQQQASNLADKRWFAGTTSQLVVGIICSIGKDFYSSRKDLIGRLKAKNVFPLTTYQATPSAKRKIHLANLSPMLLCKMMHYQSL